MDYNTSLPKMIIPEYGRNIQKMIEFAMEIEDREKRNRVANSIIAVMGHLNPHLRDVTDFKHKLWDHIFIISEFRLDVDSPYPMPTAETFKTKPDRLKYPFLDIKYKHYGKNAELVINEIAQYPEGAGKDEVTDNLANFLKRSYLTWNRDSVNDEVILKQLAELSKGKLKLKAGKYLRSTSELAPKSMPHTNRKKSSGEDGDRGGRGDRGHRQNNNRGGRDRYKKKY